MGTLYFGKQWLTKGNTCCTGGSPPSVPARGFRLVSTGGGGGGLLTFGNTVKRGSSYECLCGLISVPFTFTVHFDPVGIAPSEGGTCLLYENQRLDETLTIKYELEYASETGDSGFFRFRVSNYDNDLAAEVSTTIRTDSGYHLLGGAFQITCTYTAPPLLTVDRSLYMAIYINGLRADTSIINNDGLSSNFASWPQPSGGMNIYNSCQFDDEAPDNMQIGIVTEWNRGFTPTEAQEFFNNSINKQQNLSFWAAMFQEPPVVACDRNFGLNGNIHQIHTNGQTNTSISHNCPINDWTTTKGIGMRRKWIIGAGLTPAALPPGLSLPCGPTNSPPEDD